MPNNYLHYIDRFCELNVLVVGEAILDSYLQGASDRLCREAPVPIVDVDERLDAPGGAANTAVNARSLGANVTLLSVVGDDREGRRLRRALRQHGVNTDHLLRDRRRQTLVKHRVIGDAQLLVRFDTGTTAPVDGALEEALLHRLQTLFARHDAVIISDYGYGILTPRLIDRLAQQQTRSPRLLVADSKSLSAYCHVGLSAVKPNYGEAVSLLGLEQRAAFHERSEQIASHGQEMLQLTGAQVAAITLDKEGALIFERGRPPYRTYARPRPNTRATGAGDTYVSALALAMAAGAHTPAAAELASAASAVVVGKDGTTACSESELIAYVAGEEKFVPAAESLQSQLEYYRNQGRRIVFTNGCFDILHRGHITYLSQAKALGDVLIVGLNSDDSVKRLKGEERPINGLEDRAQVLSALSCVDHIIPFEQDTPRELIRYVQPDIMVKGGDYTRETLPEAPLVEELGGEVKILPYLDDFSTTSIIERIRRLDENGQAPARAQPLVVSGSA